MLLDADLALANVDVLLDLQPRFNLSHVVSGESDLLGTMLSGPAGDRHRSRFFGELVDGRPSAGFSGGNHPGLSAI